MFGFLRRLKRGNEEEDYNDLRMNILNEKPFDVPKYEPARPPQTQENDFSPKTRDVFDPTQPLPSFPGPFENQDNAMGPINPGNNPSRNYEILDRLNLMESQIAAIRSMTETINERLKNMETRLGLQRRY